MRDRPEARRYVVASALTAIYAPVVITASAYHEPWRDEVVPLSFARTASSLATLVAPLRFECHPILWYLLLRGAWVLLAKTWVLKVLSVGSAVAAILLLMLSPLRWWLTFAPLRRAAYDLAALLAAARNVRDRSGRPVVIALGWHLDEPTVPTRNRVTRYEETFAVAPEACDEFRAAARLVANLTTPTLTDERYDVC